MQLSTTFHNYGDVLWIAFGRPQRLSSPRGSAARVPRHSPFRIQLTRDERRELERRARQYTSPYRDVIRAKLVLLVATTTNRGVERPLGRTHWHERMFCHVPRDRQGRETGGASLDLPAPLPRAASRFTDGSKGFIHSTFFVPLFILLHLLTFARRAGSPSTGVRVSGRVRTEA